MKHRLLTGTIAASIAFAAAAGPITPEEALARVANTQHKAISASGAMNLIHTELTAEGSPAVYVFDRAAAGGYMLLSADDNALPVLGYSDSGSFDADNMPPAMKWWLEEYGRQIEYAAQNTPVTRGTQTAALEASRQGRHTVEPMLKTDWDQVEPYNDLCPYNGTERTYTGCVATAMAQVMKYWNYPERGQGYISYDAESIQKRLSLDFSLRAFDWDNMLDTYVPGKYTEKESEAVAYLMKAAGYSVKMDYGTDASGALAMYIRRGFVRYFNYDGNTRYTMRMYHSASDWEQLIYDEMAAGRPVVYGGSSIIGGGHSFVCDGYDGQGFFHFNWGWTGMSNGYYSLNALNPDALGSGGGSGGGYNFTQDAVVGIQPPTGDPVNPQEEYITQQGSLTGTIAGTKLNISLGVIDDAMWANYNPTEMVVVFGAKFELQNADAEPVYAKIAGGDKGVTLPIGYGIRAAALRASADLAEILTTDGTYKVTVVTKNVKSAAEWQPVLSYYGYNDYILVTKNGDTFTAVVPATPQISIVDGGFTGGLYYGATTRVWIELENNTDYELSSGFAPLLAQGTALVFIGESKLITMPPHSNETFEWVTDMNLLQEISGITTDTTFDLTFMDEETYTIFSGEILKPVVMKPNPGAPSVNLTQSPTVTNATYHDTAALPGYGTAEIYGVSNPNEIIVESEIILNQGYFGYPIMAIVCTEPDAIGNVSIITYGATPSVLLDKTNETATIRCTISFPHMDSEMLYPLLIAYNAGGQVYPISGGRSVLIEVAQTGIEDVAAEGSLSLTYDSATRTVNASSAAAIAGIEAYTAGGVLVGATGDGSTSLSLADAPAGIIIATARDTRGNTRTVKIRL